MAFDYKTFLAHALLEIERFSVPGLGTFIREPRQARIDFAQRTISPPSTLIRLEPGERSLNRLYEYLAEKGKLNRAGAEKFSRDLGRYLGDFLKGSEALELEGIGRLYRGSTGSPVFEPTADDPILNAYGLTPLPYVAPEEPKVVTPKDAPKQGKDKGKVKEKELAKAKEKAKKAPKENRRISVVEGEQRSRYRRVALVGVIVALLVTLGLTWYVLRPKGQATNTPKDTTRASNSTPTTKSDKESAAGTELAQPQTKPEEKKPALEKTTTPTEEPRPQPVQEKAPKGKVYHIIVGSYPSADEAMQFATDWTQKGYTTSVLPVPSSGRYRLSIFQSRSQAAANERLQQLRGSEAPEAWVLAE